MKSFKKFLKEDDYERFVQNNSQDVDIKKKLIMKIKDTKIYLVDGEEVGNKISVDFTMRCYDNHRWNILNKLYL